MVYFLYPILVYLIQEEIQMIEKMFGETPEEQYQYLKPRLIATAVSFVIPVVGVLLQLLGLNFGGILIRFGSILFAIVMLVFGWSILKGLFGVATLGVLFSNNIVLGVIVFVLYITLGYFGGLIAAVIGLCRFLVLLKERKNR